MPITSPEDRARVWTRATALRGEERETILKYLATDFLVELRSEFDLYTGYEDEFVESVLLLDECGRLLDEDLLRAYQAIAVEPEAPSRFFAELTARLGEVASGVESPSKSAERAGQLERVWRDAIAEKEQTEWLSVAETAARFGVRPQAVYKWIHAGKIDYEETPGGSYRIPALQFRTTRADHLRLRELERRLVEERRGLPAPPDDVVVEEMRARRRR
jgi:excisionase family DNA binding protein